MSASLVGVGALVAVAFYALIPGYRPLYLGVLFLALVAALIAFPKTHDPELRGPASLVLAGCVIYWTLGGSALPEWVNGPALLCAPVLIGTALFQLWRQRKAIAANNS